MVSASPSRDMFVRFWDIFIRNHSTCANRTVLCPELLAREPAPLGRDFQVAAGRG